MGSGVVPALGQACPGEHAANVVFPYLGDEAADQSGECGKGRRREQSLKRGEQHGETRGKIAAGEHWRSFSLIGVVVTPPMLSLFLLFVSGPAQTYAHTDFFDVDALQDGVRGAAWLRARPFQCHPRTYAARRRVQGTSSMSGPNSLRTYRSCYARPREASDPESETVRKGPRRGDLKSQSGTDTDRFNEQRVVSLVIPIDDGIRRARNNKAAAALEKRPPAAAPIRGWVASRRTARKSLRAYFLKSKLEHRRLPQVYCTRFNVSPSISALPKQPSLTFIK